MKRKLLSFALILATVLALPGARYADEGMWLPQDINKLPIKQMRSKGLQISPEEIYNPDAPSLRDAILRITTGGSLGTGSFVSGQGLIITNHHVAFDGVAEVSTPQANYLETGFLARTNAEELPVKNYTASITRVIKDVTPEVLSVVKPEMTQDERQKAIDTKRREISEAAKKERADLDFDVNEMVTGAKYFLYGYEVFRDIRLVYAPPKSVGFFGGDDDNFLWPRHTGDYSFLRAYATPEGKPATYSDKNVPYQPKKFLAISTDGYKEGDFTMLMGHPGRTYRLRDSFSVEFQQNYYLPYFIDVLTARINLLDELGKKDPAVALKVAGERFSLSNAVKNFEGAQAGLKRVHLVAQKRAEEAQFAKYLEEHPEQKAKYGDVISKIGDLYRDYTRTYTRNNLLTALASATASLQFRMFAVSRAIDKDKPEAERSPMYGDDRIERLKGILPQALKEDNGDLDVKLVELYLNKILALPEGQKVDYVEKRFAGKSNTDRQVAIAEFARKLVNENANAESITKLFTMSTAQIRALNDPTLDFLADAAVEFDKSRKSDQIFNSNIARLRTLYIEGMTNIRKSLFYPDANATLRFSYGEVKGYQPRDGVHYNYITTLQGVIDKDTGKEPFDVPAAIKQLHDQHNYGPFVDPIVKDVPVAFLTNNDITGGSSGSAVLNGRGELIGLAFDGNYEGLGSDYGYNADQSRTICVDIRYVLFLADKMAGAQNLFRELEIHGKAAAAVAGGKR